MTRLHCVVHGRVQGVGYRWFVKETAEQLGVTGWARNLPNGEVEIEAQGGEDVLKEFVSFLKKGPPYARVDGIDCRTVEAEKGSAVFEIRHG